MYELKMPTECTANPLQRELADSIIRLSPLVSERKYLESTKNEIDWTVSVSVLSCRMI